MISKLCYCLPQKTDFSPTTTTAFITHGFAFSLFWDLSGPCTESKHRKNSDQTVYMHRTIKKYNCWLIYAGFNNNFVVPGLVITWQAHHNYIITVHANADCDGKFQYCSVSISYIPQLSCPDLWLSLGLPLSRAACCDPLLLTAMCGRNSHLQDHCTGNGLPP